MQQLRSRTANRVTTNRVEKEPKRNIFHFFYPIDV